MKLEALRQAREPDRRLGRQMAERVKAFWRDPDGRYLERFRRLVLPF